VRVRWSGVVGVAVTLLLLWWALHDVSFRDVWAEIRGVHWGWFLAAVAVATFTFPLRAVRWRYLLRYEGAAVPLGPLWHATAIGFMANNLLPARAGELARAYAARQLTGVRFTTALASIAVERVFDGLTIVGLLLAGLAGGGFTTAAVIGGVDMVTMARGAGLLFGAVFLAALIVVWWPRVWLRLAERVLARLLPQRWAARGVSLLEGLLEGLSALRAPGRFVGVLFWSVALWTVNAASLALACYAFDLSLPFGAPFVLQGVLALGAAIPSSPGFWGVFEAASRATLPIYGVGATRSVSLAIGFHIGGFIPITLLGLWSLGRANLHLKSLRAESETESRDGGMTTGSAENVKT